MLKCGHWLRLVEERRYLVNRVTSITNLMTSALKEYYPQVLDWFEHKDTLIFCDFLEPLADA